jgi:hypothetical protein
MRVTCVKRNEQRCGYKIRGVFDKENGIWESMLVANVFESIKRGSTKDFVSQKNWQSFVIEEGDLRGHG